MKVSGVEAKNQGNVVKYNAYQNPPEYFEELDSKFGETLADKEDGVDQIIKYLEDNDTVREEEDEGDGEA